MIWDQTVFNHHDLAEVCIMPCLNVWDLKFAVASPSCFSVGFKQIKKQTNIQIKLQTKHITHNITQNKHTQTHLPNQYYSHKHTQLGAYTCIRDKHTHYMKLIKRYTFWHASFDLHASYSRWFLVWPSRFDALCHV